MEHLWAKRKVEVRYIEFTEPDSAKRQFVRSVRMVHSEEEAGGEASSSLRARTEIQVEADVEAEASQTETFKSETKRGALFWAVWVAVCLVAIKNIPYLRLFIYGKWK
jgi:hypothetical protein